MAQDNRFDLARLELMERRLQALEDETGRSVRREQSAAAGVATMSGPRERWEGKFMKRHLRGFATRVRCCSRSSPAMRPWRKNPAT
jgi:hypothetical protein